MKLLFVVPLLTALTLPALTACARTSESPSPAVSAEAPAPLKPARATAASEAPLPLMVVHKSPSCGCCALWVDHMRGAGFPVELRESDNLEPVKSRVGVPLGKGSCHTAEVGGYFVEGHVPASDVKRLLKEKPAAKGLVLPGMPMGSPGMEMPGGQVEPYTVELVLEDGSTVPFSQHGQ